MGKKYTPDESKTFLQRIQEWQNGEDLSEKECAELKSLFLQNPKEFPLKGWYPPKMQPPFQDLVTTLALEDSPEKEEHLKAKWKTLIYHDDKCCGFIPANPKNTDMPNHINPVSYHKAGDTGRCSALHVLIVPKERIYNAGMLLEQHVPLLEHMKEVGTELARALTLADSFPEGEGSNIDAPLQTAERNSLIADIQARMQQRTGSTSKHDTKIEHRYLPGGLDLAAEAAEDHVSSLVYAVQVHPNHTVGWLHLHVFSLAGLSKAGDQYLRKKNLEPIGDDFQGSMTPLTDVLRYIKDPVVAEARKQYAPQTGPRT